MSATYQVWFHSCCIARKAIRRQPIAFHIQGIKRAIALIIERL